MKALPFSPAPGAPVVSGFGPRKLKGRAAKFHNGVDFAVPAGTPLIACDDSVCAFFLFDDASGLALGFRRADGVSWSYSHLSEARVSKGQAVKGGDIIGLSGATGVVTGPHLHFRLNGVDGKAVDPLPFLPGAGGGGGAGLLVLGLLVLRAVFG